MNAQPYEEVRRLDHRSSEMAARTHEVQRAAYLQEAALIETTDFPRSGELRTK